jgi:hypothetical protein
LLSYDKLLCFLSAGTESGSKETVRIGINGKIITLHMTL